MVFPLLSIDVTLRPLIKSTGLPMVQPHHILAFHKKLAEDQAKYEKLQEESAADLAWSNEVNLAEFEQARLCPVTERTLNPISRRRCEEAFAKCKFVHKDEDSS